MGVNECLSRCTCTGCMLFIFQNPGADAALLMGIIDAAMAIWNSSVNGLPEVPYLKPITALALALSGVALITFTTSLFAEAWALYKLKRESAEFGNEVELAKGTHDKRKDLENKLKADVEKMRERITMLQELEATMTKMGSYGVGGMQKALEMFELNLERAEDNLQSVLRNISMVVQTECANFNREITDFYRRKYLEMSDNDEDWNVEEEEFENFVMIMANGHHLRCFAKALEPHIKSSKRKAYSKFTDAGFNPPRDEFKEVFWMLKLTCKTETADAPDGFDGEIFNEQVLPALCKHITADFEKSICQEDPFSRYTRLSQIDITFDANKMKELQIV